ncbi:MAG: hypothetical protein RL148_1168 [Planctomycetota bacterium]
MLGLLAVSCTTTQDTVPGRVGSLPWGRDDQGRAMLEARALNDRGETVAALAAVERVLVVDPGSVDAHRLRQDILQQRGRLGLLFVEADQRIAANPGSGEATYLRARLLDEPQQRAAAMQRSSELQPDSVWPWIGLAYAQRNLDPQRSLDLYRRVYEASGRHPVVGVGYGSVLRQEGRLDEALAVYAHMGTRRDAQGLGQIGQVQVLLAQDKRLEAWAAFLDCLRMRPFDPAVQNLAAQWLQAGVAQDQASQMLEALREDPRRLAWFAGGEGTATAVRLLRQLHQPHAALALVRGRPVAQREPALRRLERELLLATGDVRGCLEVVAQDIPSELLEDESNQLRGTWLRLVRGEWREHDPLSDPQRATSLLESLRDTGLLPEADQFGALALLRFPGHVGLTALHDEVVKALAFESEVRRLLYSGYGSPKPPSMDDVLAQLRLLSTRIHGRDVVGATPRFLVPLVGDLLDPFSSGLGAWFARYNKHLVLGQKSSGPVEGMLLTRLSLRELPRDDALPLPARCMEVVCENRTIRSVSGVIGGDIAGVALLNHFLVDHDSVRQWAGGIRQRRAVAQEDGGALASDPLPTSVDPADPLDAEWRLALACPVPDAELESAVLDTIRHHERAHLVDSFHYLPFEANLWRGLGLLFAFGFSPAAIEGEMERRAELAALALSPYTHLVLSHVAEFRDQYDPASPHGRGFRALAEELVLRLRSRGVPEEHLRTCNWHQLDPVLVREVAREMLGRVRSG